MHDDLRAAVDEAFRSVRAELEALVRIRSISAPGFDPARLREAMILPSRPRPLRPPSLTNRWGWSPGRLPGLILHQNSPAVWIGSTLPDR